ncbi:MAG: hypothetical protein WBG50_03245 [Desulfomonilaceae bacterium]
MFKIILREILVLLLSLAVFPAAGVLILIFSNSLDIGLSFLAQEYGLLGGMGPGGPAVALWVKWFAPYLVLQTIRGFLWSQRSITGRRWANLYFSALAASVAAWSLWSMWDLFYFMYALGDMPAELMQFFQLEGRNILTLLGCVFLCIYCLGIFLHPERKRQQRPQP